MRKITKELMFELILQSVPREFEEGVQIDRLNKPPITKQKIKQMVQARFTTFKKLIDMEHGETKYKTKPFPFRRKIVLQISSILI